jgi:molybdopterin synthase sulfur carrier subunit
MITLLFFAYLQDAIGQERFEMEYAPLTVKELKQQLETRYGVDLRHVMVAINEEYVREEHQLKPGDIVAFIPPVSGG